MTGIRTSVGAGSRPRGFLPDIGPLRDSPSYRLLWSGQLVSQIGSQIRLVALPYQVFVLTGSPFAVGLIGLFQAVPLIALSLAGGVIADAIDRRRLLLVTQVGLTLTSLALAVATQTGLVSVPLLYVLTAVGGAFSALDTPARSSLAPNLVERRQIPAAMALNQTLFHTSAIVGPALAGLLIVRVGLAAAYWIDVASFLVAIAAIAAIRHVTVRPPGPRAPVVRALVEGISYVRGRRILLAPMILDFLAMFLATPIALLPFYAERVFHVGPDGLGLMYAAMGVGSLIAALAATSLTRIRGQGRAILVGVGVWGVAIVAFGLTPPGLFPLALGLLALAAAGDSIGMVFRQTILQLEVADALRGRLAGINIMFVIGGPQLGQVRAGAVAAATSPETAVIAGGLLCLVAVAGVAFAAPEVTSYRVEET